jgi:RecA-family ATPase
MPGKKRFDTIDGETLMSQPLKPVEFVVSSLLPKGLHILAGTPKIGKSWLVLWLCLQIAKGEKVWNFETSQGTTIYLCLEDSKSRIQGRLFDITDDAPSNIYFATFAEDIGNGIEEQIENFVSEHSDTKLIVIDTLQKIRSAISDNAYANDYKEIGVLKSIADRLNIAILLIHHLRKSKDGDPMNDGKSQIAIWLRYNRYYRSCRFKLYSCKKQGKQRSQTYM